jgi:hypothetical protein
MVVSWNMKRSERSASVGVRRSPGADCGQGKQHSPAQHSLVQSSLDDRRARRSRWYGAAGVPVALALVFYGCSSSDETRLGAAPGVVSPLQAEQELGSLYLPLITPDAIRYRLRDATFEIERAGAVVVSLDSDADPDAEALTAELSPGQYQIRLGGGWALERLEENGSATPVRAALISPNPAVFSVRNGRVTNVAFTFTTSSGSVTFGEGSVSVRLGVADSAALTTCDIANQAGCASGQHCLLADGSGQTFCATPGDLAVGARCSSEQCVFGAQCLDLNESDAIQASACTQLCNPLFPPFGCDCLGLSFADDVGVCGPPPESACDLLDPAGCPAGQACQFPGGSFGVCGTPGTLTEGSSCFGEVCAAGFDCYGDDPALGFAGTCYRFCDVQEPACEFCFDVGTGSVGRCFL